VTVFATSAEIRGRPGRIGLLQGCGLKRIVLGLAATLVLVGAVVAAPKVPDEVRLAVEARHDAALQDMIDPEFPDALKIATPSAMFHKIDINGDGVADWRADFSKAQNASFFCGTGGCLQQIWVSRPGGGYRLAFENTVRELTLKRTAGERVLDVDFHGTTCGGFGVDPCPRRYGWSEDAGRFLERPDPRGAGWLAGGPTPAREPDAADIPAPVVAQVERRQGLCAVAGGTYPVEDNALNDIPDLNGDGIRDWVVGSAYSACTMPETGGDSPDLPLTLLVSAPGGGFVVGWEKVGPSWGIELGSPNRLATLVGEDCFSGDKPCAKVWWRWTGTTFEQQP